MATPRPARHPAPSAPSAWRQWWLQRLRPSDDLELTHRNLYILPTRAGMMLGLTLLLLLVASINYQLNLGYLLTFLLTGCAVVALHLTHRNLRGLRFHLVSPDPVFAGQSVRVLVRLHNPQAQARYGLGLSWMGWPGQPSPDPTWTDVDAGQQSQVELHWPVQQRGFTPLPALLVQTHFPLGTTRAWHWWRPAARVLAYPCPEQDAPALPWEQGPGASRCTTQHPRAQTTQPELDWDGTRAYRPGDPLKRVLWKKVARSAEGPTPTWVVRDTEARPPSQRLWLDAAHTGLADREAALSRLCAWVLQAEQLGLDYGLRLPGLELPASHGPDHQRRCLEALACQ